MVAVAKRIVDKERILACLRRGPASMTDLMSISASGYRQRISDLRADGYLIDCVRTPRGSVFVFKGHREDGQLALGFRG